MFSTYAIAANEVNNPGGYGTYHCWAKEFLGPCATADAAPAVASCVDQLEATNGHIHSTKKSRSDLIACMRSSGWHRIEEFVLIN